MMSQFSAAKNPPWARQDYLSSASAGLPPGAGLAQSAGAALLSQQQMVAQQGIYTASVAGAGLAQQQQQQLAASLHAQQALQQSGLMQQPGINIPTSLAAGSNAPVTYPNQRAAQGAGNLQQKQRVFTGTITKLHDNFGFVDQEVFFQMSAVKGPVPKVGERVLVEASFNPSMPFKWNATRVQILQNQSATGGQVKSVPVVPVASYSMTTPPPPLMGQQSGVLGAAPGPNRQTPAVPVAVTAGRSDPPAANRFDRDRRDRDRERERDRRPRRESPPRSRKRSRSPVRQRSRSRSRSPSRRSSPSRRARARPVPRYMVQVPKIALDSKDASVIGVKTRYPNMYVPSDFFHATFSWTQAFKPQQAFDIGQSCSFHVMPKEIGPLKLNNTVFEPPDSDHLFSAKVMLLAMPTLEELSKKACILTEHLDDSDRFQHPSRLINFLVALKGKSEPMAIGGAWSASLDGADPRGDPQVLIKTAIRTTKALTGIDLSACTQWYRFAEISYLRPEESHKGKLVPAHVETVTLFLPDVWSCMPTQLDWSSLRATYKHHVIARLSGEPTPEETSQEEDEDTDTSGGGKPQTEPTHHKLLDAKTMKIADYRRELELRGQSPKGLRAQLAARLNKLLKSEKDKEEDAAAEAEATKEEKQTTVEESVKEETAEPATPIVVDEEAKAIEEEKRKKIEEKAAESRYCLTEKPSVLVHPSQSAKGGKFDCTLMSLSVLLDYRPEDTKEHSFEVSLFAELFNEMLMRDFGFRIYKSLVDIPDKKEEEKKDRTEKKDEEKKKDDDKKKDEKDTKKDDKDKDVKEPALKKVKTSNDTESKETASKGKTGDDDITDSQKSDEKGEKHEKVETMETDGDKGSKDDKDSTKNGKDDDSENKSENKRDKRDREREKRYTAYPELLLAFVYFDQNHCGHILNNDLEEILHTIGLQLSRAQLRKLLLKVSAKDVIHYRKLTDKVVGKDTEDQASKEGRPSRKINPLYEGNNLYLDELKHDNQTTKSSPSKTSVQNGDVESSMIHYKGGLLDIESLMDRLDKSEKSRSTTEKKLGDVTKEGDKLKDKLHNSLQKQDKLTKDLEGSREKVAFQQKCSSTMETKYQQCMDMLAQSRTVLSDLVSGIDSVLPKPEKPDTDVPITADNDTNSPSSTEATDKASVSVKQDDTSIKKGKYKKQSPAL